VSREKPSATFAGSKSSPVRNQRASFILLVLVLLVLGWFLQPPNLPPDEADTPLPSQPRAMPLPNLHQRPAFDRQSGTIASVSPPANPRFVPGQILVAFRSGFAASDTFARLQNDLISHHPIPGNTDLHLVKVREAQTERVITLLRSDPAVQFVERNAIARAAFVPNDPYVSSGSEWHLAKIQAEAAWDITTGNTNTVVAVLDSGVNAAHPDLAGKILPGYNFVSSTNDTSDDFGHGTAVAGTVAAAGNNNIGVAGVAYGCILLPVKVVDSSGFAAYSALVQGIHYAVDHGARIINLSIAGDSPSDSLQSAVDYAWSNNVVVVAAAGNNSNSTPQYPAACRHVVAVSATEPDDSLATFSSYGNYISLSAPGDNIWTTMRDLANPYGSWRGTSFSSPIVAAVAALVSAANPSLSNGQIVSLMENKSDDLGTNGYDTSFGFGRINAFRAVQAAANAPGGVIAPPAPPDDVVTNSPATNSPTQTGRPRIFVQTDGDGRVTPNLSGKPLLVGRTYTLRAIPGPGQIFTGWTGGNLDTTSPLLTFVAQTNFTVTASFVPSPFPPMTGNFRGLFAQTNGVTPANSGYVAVTLRSLGSFTGSISIGGGHYGFNGRFDPNGNARFQILRGEDPSLTMALHVDLVNGTDQIVGTVTDGTWVSDVSADRNVFNSRWNPAQQAGSRAFVLEEPDTSDAATGVSRIKPSGATQVRGQLLDGRRFSTASTLAKNGDYPFYLSLHQGSEILIGWLNFPAGEPSLCSGTVVWSSFGTNAFATSLKVDSAH
jgi:subtilisin family serine protease